MPAEHPDKVVITAAFHMVSLVDKCKACSGYPPPLLNIGTLYQLRQYVAVLLLTAESSRMHACI
jgi:hypothetical protein